MILGSRLLQCHSYRPTNIVTGCRPRCRELLGKLGRCEVPARYSTGILSNTVRKTRDEVTLELEVTGDRLVDDHAILSAQS